MIHTLHLDTSPRSERSHSRTLAREFLETWKVNQPEARITYRDLSANPVPIWQHQSSWGDRIRLHQTVVESYRK